MSSMPGYKVWCHSVTEPSVSMVTLQGLDVYQVLPTCHVYIKAIIKFSASESLLLYIFFLKSCVYVAWDILTYNLKFKHYNKNNCYLGYKISQLTCQRHTSSSGWVYGGGLRNMLQPNLMSFLQSWWCMLIVLLNK